MNIRKIGFFLLDLLKGAPIYRDIHDIKTINESLKSANTIKKLEIRKLAILKHAKRTVPYYQNGIIKSNNIDSFPILNKNIIRDNLRDFISSEFKIEKLNRSVTSGSTGTPFVVYQDARKKRRNTADTIYFGKNAGFDLGSKLYYLKIWNSVNRKHGLISFCFF